MVRPGQRLSCAFGTPLRSLNGQYRRDRTCDYASAFFTPSRTGAGNCTFPTPMVHGVIVMKLIGIQRKTFAHNFMPSVRQSNGSHIVTPTYRLTVCNPPATVYNTAFTRTPTLSR